MRLLKMPRFTHLMLGYVQTDAFSVVNHVQLHGVILNFAQLVEVQLHLVQPGGKQPNRNMQRVSQECLIDRL